MKWNSMKYISGLAVLIFAAFMLPRLLFAVQDRERMGEVGQGSRLGINFAALEENYEASRISRLGRYAQGRESGKDYYVSEVAFELSFEEQAEILEKAYVQAPIWLMENVQAALGRRFFGAMGRDSWVEISDWKKYVVYDAENVSFICWYADVLLDSGESIRMLLDAEDGSFYYMQVRRAKQDDKDKKAASMAAAKGVDFFVDYENLSVVWVLCAQYYSDVLDHLGIEAEDEAQGAGAVMDEYGENANAVRYAYAWEAAFDRLYKEAEKRGLDPYELLFELAGEEMSVTDSEFSFPLHYGEETLEFEVFFGEEFLSEEMPLVFSIGIPAVGELIPEMEN